jgi:DNA-directed RNA polymerase subunit RPC12/RpoP
MIYLELDDDTLDSHYKYASSIKGVKPDDNWVSNEVVIDDDYTSSSSTKNTNTTNTVVDKETCEHQYAVYSSTDATCESKGTVVYKCLKCNNEYTATTEALGHKYVNGVCTRCNKKDSSVNTNSTNQTPNNNAVKDEQTGEKEHTEHSYTVEVSRTPSTCTQQGSVTMKCSGCDKTKTETLPLIDHEGTGPTCTVCGEPNPNYKDSTSSGGSGDGDQGSSSNPPTSNSELTNEVGEAQE